MPMIHVNCFVVADSDEKSSALIVERVGKMLPGFKKEEIVILHHIKNVTVIMRMYCLSFKLR
jgi:phenylpyruvate tautomerase PptA (4-oxalocrotonate tautomerase family)